MGIICLLEPLRYLASFRSKTPWKFCGWGDDPQIGGMGGLKWVKNGPIRKCNISFLLARRGDQSAISNRFRRTQQRNRQTGGQNWCSYSVLMLRADALASAGQKWSTVCL